MVSNTPNLNTPLIEAAQSQKHVTANQAFSQYDCFINCHALSRTTTTPDPSPTEGMVYIVADVATGVWSTKDGKLAMYVGGTWVFATPKNGFSAFVEDEHRSVLYIDGAWVEGQKSPKGALMYSKQVEVELTLSGASVATTGGDQIPARSVLFSVSSRTTVAITGAVSYEVGVSGNTSQFGGSLGISAGSTNVGVIGPTAFYSDTPVVITAVTGVFTAGKVRLTLQYMVFTAPTS